MDYAPLATVWTGLGKTARIVIATERARWDVAERIARDVLPHVRDVSVIDVASDDLARIEALTSEDLIVVSLTVDGFMREDLRSLFPPFHKPRGLRCRYVFVRLDIPERALLTGLNTDLLRVEGRVRELSRLQAGATVRVTTAAGTDVVLRTEQQEVLPYDARDLGGNAFLPPAEVSEVVAAGSAEGTIVVDVTVGELRVRGDLVDALGLVDTPVTLRVERGLVAHIEGGHTADRLRRGLRALPPDAACVVELGHGLSDIEPTGIIGVDESMAGTCHFGIGDGTLYHLDVVLANPRFTLLGE